MPQQRKLFSSLDLGQRRLKNRIVSTAHGENFAQAGIITDHLMDYHVRRAQGGVGLIIAFGSATVHPDASNDHNVALWKSDNEPRLRRLADRVHEHDCLIMSQATHRSSREAINDLDGVLQVPSPLPASFKQNYYGTPHVLTTTEIEDIVEHYGIAAKRLADAHFDGIELTTLGSHLMELFWSPLLNTRTDRYGGDFEGRLRLTLDVIEAVRANVPSDFIVAFRLSCDLTTDRLGLDGQEIARIARRIDETGGISLFNISGGSGFDTNTHAAVVPPAEYPDATYADAAAGFRKFLSAPVLLAGKITSAKTAEQVLENGSADLVAMTRPLIADPELPNRLMHGESERIRPCIAINEGCRRVTIGRSLACTVNPGVADPALMAFEASKIRKRVSVVGAGPAGLEAARLAAERGHAVSICDAAGVVGGQLIEFAEMARWPQLLRHIDWLQRELDRMKVPISLGKRATGHGLALDEPDEIIVATGAQTTLPPEALPLGDRALRDVDLLRSQGRKSGLGVVAVYDVEGRLRGARSAILAKELGAKKVVLINPQDIACENLEPPNRPVLYRELDRHGIEIKSHNFTIDQDGDGIRIEDSWSGKVERITCDHVIFAGFRQSDNGLYNELFAAGYSNLHLVGDCRAPRLLRNAISEGTRAGFKI